MNATDFNKSFAGRMNITQQEATQRINDIVDVFEAAFKEQKTVSLPRFGHFSTRKLESRKGYSPVLKKYVIFPPKRVLEFYPSDQLRLRVKNVDAS